MSPVDVEALATAVAERLSERMGLDTQLLSVNRVAEMLDVSPRTVRDMIARGTLPSLKIEGTRRIKAADLSRYVSRRATEAAAHTEEERHG